jgi:hypothetical protein
MHPLLVLQEAKPEPLPIAETGGVVLAASLLVTVGWLLYLSR